MITIILLDGKQISLNIEPSDLIIKLKVSIFEKEKVEVKKQILFYKGAVLTDNKTVEDYNILKESTIHLIIKKEINVEKFSIYINLLGKKNLLLMLIFMKK